MMIMIITIIKTITMKSYFINKNNITNNTNL